MVEHDRPASMQLRQNIETLRSNAQAEDGDSAELRALIGTAERVAELADGMVGSCERGRPFADMFIVALANNTLVWRCTHDPAHDDIPV